MSWLFSKERNTKNEVATAPTYPLELAEGQTIVNRYQIIRAIGSGASGTVYAATDYFRNNQVVALKIFKKSFSEDPEKRERLIRETAFLRRFAHHNVIQFYEAINDEGLSGFSMEYVDGITLDQLMKSNYELTIEEKVLILYQICCGIEAIHQSGLVHRDIKPANILMTSEGVWKIADFGIAHRPGEISDSDSSAYDTNSSWDHDEVTHAFAKRLTLESGLTGTLHYLSPEYIKNREVSPQGDIYSFGYLAYKLLQGEAPYRDKDPRRLLQLKVTTDPEVLVIPRAPHLGPIIAKCMARETSERFSEIQEIVDALRPHITDLLTKIEKTEYSQMSVIEQGFCINAAKQLATATVSAPSASGRHGITFVPNQFDPQALLADDTRKSLREQFSLSFTHLFFLALILCAVALASSWFKFFF